MWRAAQRKAYRMLFQTAPADIAGVWTFAEFPTQLQNESPPYKRWSPWCHQVGYIMGNALCLLVSSYDQSVVKLLAHKSFSQECCCAPYLTHLVMHLSSSCLSPMCESASYGQPLPFAMDFFLKKKKCNLRFGSWKPFVDFDVLENKNREKPPIRRT